MSNRTHDPVKTLDELRNHLALHDKPIAFFFGAGTSCSIRIGNDPLIPAVEELTGRCRDAAQALGDEFLAAWDSIASSYDTDTRKANVEDILSHLRTMIAAIGDSDKLSGLYRAQLKKLDATTRATIATAVNPKMSSVPEAFPHRQFARWISRSSHHRPVEVFTVNYDVLIEHGMEVERVPLHDGFVGSYRPFFYPESLQLPESQPGASWSRLWKMHGSVTWRRVDRGGRSDIVRGNPESDGEMIYPSLQKYEQSRQQPYVAFRDRLAWFLGQQDAVLIIAGFSFADEHINDLLFRALENHPRTHIYALQFRDEPADSDLTKRAEQHRNILVIGPKTAVISGRRFPWYASNVPAVLGNVIRSGGNGDEEDDVEVRIGDFAVFCQFIESMTERD